MQKHHHIICTIAAMLIGQVSAATLAHADSDMPQDSNLRYDGEVTVSIQNDTALPIILTGTPTNEETCEVNFQFDDYNYLTTAAFFMYLPAGTTQHPNLKFKSCFDPESFEATYSVQVANRKTGIGKLTVSCNFDIGACEATTTCDATSDGFLCDWSGGQASYQFILKPPPAAAHED